MSTPSRIPTVAEFLHRYRDISPEERIELKSWLFHQWGLRADSDPWGQLAGEAFDALEAMDRVEGAQS
jgi:hypothetical protein